MHNVGGVNLAQRAVRKFPIGMQTPSDYPIAFLWQQRAQLRPLLDQYGARVLGKALARLHDLEHSRTGCHQIAALMMALTDFQNWYDYADCYSSLGPDDPAVVTCLLRASAAQARQPHTSPARCAGALCAWACGRHWIFELE